MTTIKTSPGTERAILDRRQLLKRGMLWVPALSVAGVFSGTAEAAQTSPHSPPKTLCLRNLHTEESVNTCFWDRGHYLEEGLRDINRLLRDHRSNEVARMDVNLLNSLHSLATQLDADEIEVISGYRSPSTNERLRQQGHKVAKSSYHLSGRAIDVRFVGKRLKHCLNAALSHHSGGVGYYPESSGIGFIHLDTGRKRQWGPI